MKRLENYIAICIFLLTVSAAAQLPRPRILEAFSQDKTYKLTSITAYIDTVITQNMTYESGKVIWEKEIPFEGLAVVSNLGEFIIFYRGQFTIFDEDANVKTVLKTGTQTEEYLINYSGCDLENNYYFSIDGKTIYGIFEDRQNNRLILIAFSNSSREEWRKPIDGMFSDKTRPTITPIQNGVLLHNYSGAGPYPNLCFFVNSEGQVFNQYQADFRRPHPPYISPGDTTEVILYNGDSLNVYSQQTGQYIRNVNDEELIAMLNGNDQEEIWFALDNIFDNKNKDELILENVERFKQLTNHENKRIARFSHSMISTVYQSR